MGGLGLAERELTVACEFSEKAIMLCKAAVAADSRSYREIVAADTPVEAKRLGKLVEGFDQKLWDKVVCSVAFEVVLQKFQKSPPLQAVLLGTADSLIAEATRADKVWGIGMDTGDPRICRPTQWKGANVLGWALMEVRAKFRDLAG